MKVDKSSSNCKIWHKAIFLSFSQWFYTKVQQIAVFTWSRKGRFANDGRFLAHLTAMNRSLAEHSYNVSCPASG